MFLGVKSSTVSFTSEEVNKLRAARDESRTRSMRNSCRDQAAAAAPAAALPEQQGARAQESSSKAGGVLHSVGPPPSLQPDHGAGSVQPHVLQVQAVVPGAWTQITP